jgi:hypothetical protein
MGTDWSALGNLISSTTPLYTRPGSGAAQFGANANQAFQEQQVQEALRKEEAKRKAAQKSKTFGKIGSTLGTLAGAALAPLTGGASLLIPAALGAGGAALGGAAGEAIGGGSPDLRDVAQYGLEGGIAGFMGGKGAGFGKPGVDATGMIDQSISGPLTATPRSMAQSTFGSMFGSKLPGVPSYLHGNVPLGGMGTNRFGYGAGRGLSGSYQIDPNTGEYVYMPGGGY